LTPQKERGGAACRFLCHWEPWLLSGEKLWLIVGWEKDQTTTTSCDTTNNQGGRGGEKREGDGITANAAALNLKGQEEKIPVIGVMKRKPVFLPGGKKIRRGTMPLLLYKSGGRKKKEKEPFDLWERGARGQGFQEKKRKGKGW